MKRVSATVDALWAAHQVSAEWARHQGLFRTLVAGAVRAENRLLRADAEARGDRRAEVRRVHQPVYTDDLTMRCPAITIPHHSPRQSHPLRIICCK